MAETWVPLPELAALIGEDRARALARKHGGTPIYVPVKPCATHLLAFIVGMQAMVVLCSAFGGEYITVPNGRRAEPQKGDVLRRLEAGQSPSAIALELGITERYVRMVAARLPRMRQLTLPL